MRALLYMSKFFCDAYPFSQLNDFYVPFYKLRETFQIIHVLCTLKLFHVQIKNHSFIQHLLNAYNVTDTVQTPGDTFMRKTNKYSGPHGIYILVKRNR